MRKSDEKVNQKQTKYNLLVVNAELFNHSPERYELRKGTLPDAPPCPFGHRFKWIGYDLIDMKYVRVTKSVFKRLMKKLDAKEVQRYVANFKDLGESE